MIRDDNHEAPDQPGAGPDWMFWISVAVVAVGGVIAGLIP
jgi:hypothetical protein